MERKPGEVGLAAQIFGILFLLLALLMGVNWLMHGGNPGGRDHLLG